MNIKKILYVLMLIIPFSLAGSPTGLELDIEVELLPTAQFNLADWNDPAINLWMVTLTNKTDHDTLAFIEFRLDVQGVSGITSGDNPVVWGVTARIDLPAYGTKVLYSADFSGDGDMKAFEIMDKFRTIIETNGYLPSGTYDIRMLVWTGTTMEYDIFNDCDKSSRMVEDTEDNNLLDISWDSDYVNTANFGPWSWNDPKAQERGDDILENVIVNTVNIQEPVLNADVNEPYPWFRWDSPGFRAGINIDYRVRVAQFNPDLHSSYTDALEDVNSLYFDSDWDPQYTDLTSVSETGTVQPIAFQFPSGDRDLACGYQYVWQVEAREYLDDETVTKFDMEGFDGVWGYPESIKSSVFIFNFGKRLTRDNVNSPSDGMQVGSVLPIFSWEQVSCASEYELWITDALEDPDVENPFYQSEPIQSLPYQYPADAPGLMPGKRYAWKVRFNPSSEASPWSDILNFSVSRMTMTEPGRNEVLTTVLPMFNADLPADAATFELRISDMDDDNVDMGNIFSEKILSLPFQYPRDAGAGLFPGNRYYWKLILLDGSDNMVGLPDDYTDIASFSISSVMLLTPDNNERDLSLQPLFSWDTPTDVSQFELMISDVEDPEVQNPMIQLQVKGNFFQYPADADMPLEHGKDYYWTVVPMDDNGNSGTAVQSRKFTIQDKPLAAAPDLQINGLAEICSCDGNLEFTIMWSAVADADAYQIILSESAELDEDGLLAERLYESEDITQTQFQLSRDIYNFEFQGSYFFQVTGLKQGEIHSYSSELKRFSYCGERGVDTPPAVSVTYSPQDLRIPVINLDSETECADGYRVRITDEADGGNILIESEDLKSFPYAWQECADILEFSGTYYLSFEALRDGEPFGAVMPVMTLNIPDAPGITEIPDLNVSISADRPRCPLVSFSIVGDGGTARLLISENSDLDDSGVLSDLLNVIEDVRQTSVNLCDLDIELNYNSVYYIQTQSMLTDGTYSQPSALRQFKTLEQPGASDEFQFSMNSSTVNPCVISIGLLSPVSGAEGYYIEIYDTPDRDNLVNSMNIQSFPFDITVDGEEYLFSTMYYAFGTALAGGMSHGLGSPMVSFRTCDKPGSSSSPEFTFILDEKDPRNITVNLITKVEGAEEYSVVLAVDRELTTTVIEQAVAEAEFPLVTGGEELQYNTNYYLMIQAYADGALHGLASAIQTVSIPLKPGAGEQTALAVNLTDGSLQPLIEIINSVTGATGYLVTVARDRDMNDIIGEFEITGGLSLNYPSDLSPLEFGRVYYLQAQAYDENGPHGMASSVFSIFVPGIIPPVPGQDLFTWQASTPPAPSYMLEVSGTEDFSATLISETVQGLNYAFNMDRFQYNGSYYWRVIGIGNDGNYFGDWSPVVYFETEKVTGPVLLNPQGAETPMYPEFSWVTLPQGARYILELSEDADYANIIWQQAAESSPVKYPESAYRLANSSRYFWRVSAYTSDDVFLTQSETYEFLTEKLLTVQNLSPNGVGLTDLTPQLSWEAVATASSYRVRVYSSPELADIVFEKDVSENRLQVEDGVLSSNSRYYWNVTALNDRGDPLSEPSSTAGFVSPSQNSVTLLSPLGITVTASQPSFTWNKVENARGYQFILATDPDLANRITEEKVEGSKYDLSIKLTEYGSTYYWQVWALDDGGAMIGEASSVGNFNLASITPLALKNPESGAELSAANAVFSWESVEGAANYAIQFGPDGSFEDGVSFISAAANYTYKSDSKPLEANRQYSWQVRALDASGNPLSLWSDVRSFTVKSTAVIAAESPAAGAKVFSTNPIFRWTLVEGADAYEIMVAGDESFGKVMWNTSSIRLNQGQYPKQGADPLAGGSSYWWKVRALSKGNALTAYTSVSSFMVSLEMIPQVTGPNNTVTESLTPTFSWSSVEGAHHYELVLAIDEEGQQIYYQNGNISQTQLIYPDNAPPLYYSTKYYWHIRALNEDGTPLGDRSRTAVFTTTSGEIELEIIFAEN